MWILDTWEQISHLRSLPLKSVVTFSRHPLYLWWKTVTIRAAKSILFGLSSPVLSGSRPDKLCFQLHFSAFCKAAVLLGGCQVGGWPQILLVPTAGWDSLAVPGKLSLCPEMAALPLEVWAFQTPTWLEWCCGAYGLANLGVHHLQALRKHTGTWWWQGTDRLLVILI